jgi:hypothetical protein
MSEMRPHGIIKDALLAVYAFKTEVIDENTLVQAFKAVEWEKFPPLLQIVLTPDTQTLVANAYRRAFGAPIGGPET